MAKNDEIKTVPNQKLIKIKKAKCDKDHLYTIINLHAMDYAMETLTFNEYKIWCYFTRNQDGYVSALSSQEISENCNIHKRNVQLAINTLIEKGFFVQVANSNRYMFHEMPIQEEKKYEDSIKKDMEESEDVENIW